MTKKELELAGTILYTCEGTRLRRDTRYPNGNTFIYAIEFTNSDPVLVKVFLKFMRRVIKIEVARLRCELFIYNDLDKEKLENFWSSATKIPLDQFNKTIVLTAKNSKYKPNSFGTCKIRYTDKEAFLKLNNLIKNRLGTEVGVIK